MIQKDDQIITNNSTYSNFVSNVNDYREKLDKDPNLKHIEVKLYNLKTLFDYYVLITLNKYRKFNKN
jgi:hypothetical protein